MKVLVYNMSKGSLYNNIIKRKKITIANYSVHLLQLTYLSQEEMNTFNQTCIP
jgi:hypothetical protein